MVPAIRATEHTLAQGHGLDNGRRINVTELAAGKDPHPIPRPHEQAQRTGYVLAAYRQPTSKTGVRQPRPHIGTTRCACSWGLPTETDMDDNYTVADFILDTLAWIAAISVVGIMAIFGPIFFGV